MKAKSVMLTKRFVYHINVTQKKRKYLQNLLKEINFYSVIIFTRTKHGANRLAAEIKSSNISSDALHGNKSQAARPV